MQTKERRERGPLRSFSQMVLTPEGDVDINFKTCKDKYLCLLLLQVGQRYVTVLFMMHKSASSSPSPSPSPSSSMSASVITRSGCELHANVLSFSQPNICFSWNHVLYLAFLSHSLSLTHTYIFFLCFPQTFPASQILVVDGDRLVYDPFPEVRRVEDFLGLEHEITQDHFVFNATKGFYCIKSPGSGDDKCLNETKGRRHPKVPSCCHSYTEKVLCSIQSSILHNCWKGLQLA